VIDASVNPPWNAIADSLDAAETVTDDAEVVSDVKNSLIEAI
jgi:hypothetical protein